LAQLTTLNPALGLVSVMIAPGRSEEFELLLSELEKDILLEIQNVIGYKNQFRQ
jgi:hypothetical protein